MRKFALLFLFGFAFAQEPAARKPDRTVVIVAERFLYSPSRITIRQGELVEFILTSEDTGHGFRIPSAGVDLTIPAQNRAEAKVRFLARVKGEYGFECSRACGAGHNLMRGTIIVE